MSMCWVFSCVIGRGCFLWPVHSLGKTLLAFALLHFVLQGQMCLLLQVSLDLIILHTSPLWWKGHLFWVLVVEVLVGLHRIVQLQILQHYWLGHRLGYCDIKWFALETNSDHSVIFNIASSYHISASFFDYEQLEHLTSLSFLDFFFGWNVENIYYSCYSNIFIC